jgi:hypothetical protein
MTEINRALLQKVRPIEPLEPLKSSDDRRISSPPEVGHPPQEFPT